MNDADDIELTIEEWARQEKEIIADFLKYVDDSRRSKPGSYPEVAPASCWDEQFLLFHHIPQ